MNTLYYKSSSGTVIDLFCWPVMAQDYEKLLSYEWKHETVEMYSSGTLIYSSRRPIKEVEMTVSIFCQYEQDFDRIQREMSNEFDRDIRNKTPGRIYWDEKYLECYISGVDYSDFEEDFDATDITLKITAAKPFWIEEDSYYFEALASDQEIDLNYPHNYPHNYAVETTGNRNINIDSAGESDYTLIVYGPCSNPVVNIGDHPYSVTCNILDGEYLMIDTRRKSIKDMPICKVGVSGEITNLFNSRNKTESVFKKIQPGSNLVAWSGAFKFDLTVYVERSLPL